MTLPSEDFSFRVNDAGANDLRVLSLKGRESMSETFAFDVELFVPLSTFSVARTPKLLGCAATLRLGGPMDPRYDTVLSTARESRTPTITM